MTKKQKPTPPVPRSPTASRGLVVALDESKKNVKPVASPNQVKSDAVSRLMLSAGFNSIAVVDAYTGSMIEGKDFGSLMETLAAEIGDVQAGDMKRAEAMLYGQAHALQAVFVRFARLANGQTQVQQWEAFMRMAMKAQNQCRMTLETLSALKNPPVVYAKQANINNGGQQQVNNGIPAPAAPAQAAKPITEQTELLEASHGERMDTRATSSTGGADPHLEAVGEVHRTAHVGRQEANGTQRMEGRKVARAARAAQGGELDAAGPAKRTGTAVRGVTRTRAR